MYDAEPGQIDRDFQHSTTIHSSWNGFFDQESGILKYEIIIDTVCRSADDFTLQSNVRIYVYMNIFMYLNYLLIAYSLS